MKSFKQVLQLEGIMKKIGHNPKDVHSYPTDSYESAPEAIFNEREKAGKLTGRHPIYAAYSKKHDVYYHSHKPFDLGAHEKWQEDTYGKE